MEPTYRIDEAKRALHQVVRAAMDVQKSIENNKPGRRLDQKLISAGVKALRLMCQDKIQRIDAEQACDYDWDEKTEDEQISEALSARALADFEAMDLVYRKGLKTL